MDSQTLKIRDGIIMFKGKFSRNLLFDPVVSNSYFLENGDELIIFDPSCGKKIAKRIETHIKRRRIEQMEWTKALIIAGHSHIDHANNFYLSDKIGASKTHIYVHERGFKDGQLMNQPGPFIEDVVQESKKYYNFYKAFPVPYNLPMYLFAALDSLSPVLARKVFGLIGGIPFPAPADGSVVPEPLKEGDTRAIDLKGIEVRGWNFGSIIILPTPGHTPCSISLYWPEQKALFISDADWIGNPVFMSASLRDSIASLNTMKELIEAGKVDVLLPAHGQVKEGTELILRHFNLRINLLETLRDEVLATYRSCGEEKDVRKLTKVLTQESQLFSTLKLANYPRHVFFVHNIVGVCLREEGILK